MQVRRIVLYTLVLLILAMGLAIYGGMQLVMIPAVEHIESREASDNVLRPVRVVENEIISLEGTALDWAHWDETYFFAKDQREDYIENNLMDTTFTSLKLDLMLYYDLNGELIYGKAYDFEGLQPLEIPEGLHKNPVKSQLDALGGEIGEENTGIQGIIRLPEGLLLVSINPILQSDSTGPMTGHLCIGRYLDATEIRKIAHLTSTNLSVSPVGDATFSGIVLPATLNSQEMPTRVMIPGDGSTIASFAVMEDIYGMPAAVFRVDSPRTTYQIARESMLLFFYLIAGIGCVSVLSVIYFLDHNFLSRLSYLERRMKEIADRQDFSGRTHLTGDDELTSLSSRIDYTLDALEEHILSEHAAVERARIANEKLSLLSRITRHDILNQVTVIRGFADLSRETLSPHSPAIPYLDRISSASATIEDQLAFTREYELAGAHANPVWFNIRDLAAGVVRKMALGAVEVRVDTGDLEVYSDPLLEKIVFNLVDNSLKHGEKVTQIRVSFQEDGESGVLIYEDNGVGIQNDQKEQIFEQGFGRHLGLGLFLSRGILAVTGITICETGVPGEGSRFEMRIPKGLFRVKRPGD